MRRELYFGTSLSKAIVFAVIWALIGMIPCNIVRAENLNNSSEEVLDYSEEAINDSLKNYSYEENPYYIEGLEQYVNYFNEFYEEMGTEQQVRIIQLEDVLKEAGISNSLRKKILSAEGKNVLEDTGFKRVEEVEDSKIFFSKGNYYELSSKAKDDFDDEYDIFSVLFYLGNLKDNKPNGEGALFSLNDSGMRLFYAGDFKEGRSNGKGILFDNESFGAIILGKGEFKNNIYHGKFTEYNTSDLKEIYWLYREKWSEYKESYFNQYDENKKKQILANLLNKDAIAELMYITESYEGQDDKFFYVRVNYPVIEPTISYKGKYEKGFYSGKGVLYGKVGTLWYDGEFRGGTYSGKGTLYYATTGIKQYEGQFRNGMMDGKGTLYNIDGTVRKKGKFNSEDVDYEDEALEKIGMYEIMIEKFNEIELQKIFEK